MGKFDTEIRYQFDDAGNLLVNWADLVQHLLKYADALEEAGYPKSCDDVRTFVGSCAASLAAIERT